MVDYSLRRRPRKFIDKRAILKDEDFRRRTRLAINFIADVRDLTNETMAAKMEVKIGTLANYRAMKTSPKYEFVMSFCKTFDFNEDWFLKNKGEPFPGACTKYPNYFGPETPPPPALHIKEGAAAWTADGAAQKINIDEAWGKTYKVLKSGTPYAVALYLNIQQFSSALDATHELHTCQDRITNLETQVDDLRRQVDGLTAPPTGADQQAGSLEKEAM